MHPSPAGAPRWRLRCCCCHRSPRRPPPPPLDARSTGRSRGRSTGGSCCPCCPSAATTTGGRQGARSFQWLRFIQGSPCRHMRAARAGLGAGSSCSVCLARASQRPLPGTPPCTSRRPLYPRTRARTCARYAGTYDRLDSGALPEALGFAELRAQLVAQVRPCANEPSGLIRRLAAIRASRSSCRRPQDAVDEQPAARSGGAEGAAGGGGRRADRVSSMSTSPPPLAWWRPVTYRPALELIGARPGAGSGVPGVHPSVGPHTSTNPPQTRTSGARAPQRPAPCSDCHSPRFSM